MSLAKAHKHEFRIFRTIHVVWIGDEAKQPDNCIETWRQMNPGWEVRIWRNHDLRSESWENSKHIQEMMTLELCGVADMMRWEILCRHGGFAVEADSICVRPLENWLFEPDLFACWQNDIERSTSLVANGFVYSHPGNRLIRHVISDIHELPNMAGGRAWQLVGPQRLTDTIRKMRYTEITIYPSHFFIPDLLTGLKYVGNGPVFAKHFWASTHNTYDTLAKKKISDLII